MSRIWLACAALLALVFVALLALSAHGPQLLAALFDMRVPDLPGAPPAASGTGGKAGSPLAALAPAAGVGGSALRLSPFEQALVVHGFHALALGLAALWIAARGGLFANLAALGFLAGTLLFSGGIYLRAMGQPVDAGLTPLGGTILLGAWAVFALAALFGGASAGATAARPVARPAPAAAPRPAARPAPASAATVFTGWATAAAPAAARAAAPQQPARPPQVETRHQENQGVRPPVAGPPKRPAVSR